MKGDCHHFQAPEPIDSGGRNSCQMEHLKPLNVMDNIGFWPERAAVIDAIQDVLHYGRAGMEMSVRDYGRYRSSDWRDEGNNLVPWQSVDWYVYDALSEDRMQVDATQILDSLSSEPWRDDRLIGDHYDLFLMEEDMYMPAPTGESEDPAYCVGGSKRDMAAVVSVHRIDHIWGLPYGNTKTEVMRQLCFMFGIPTRSRPDVRRSLKVGRGVYCTNDCILGKVEEAPEEWDRLTEQRIQRGAFCEHCEEDLRSFFQPDGGDN